MVRKRQEKERNPSINTTAKKEITEVKAEDDKIIFISMERIFELRIDEDDELSGIDSISLVDEPAIEVNWLAFNKEKEDFHIPEGEDHIYLEKLAKIAHSEQELLDEGWEIDKVYYFGKEGFATNPNADSDWDESQYRIRYKYMLRPEIKERAIINTTRDFCKDLINKNYVWRVEEMDSLVNDFGSPAIVWRGGFNCRHIWAKIRYKKTGDITNKASANKNKATVGDFPLSSLMPELDILGYPQPSTITNPTLVAVQEGRSAPNTARNLGLSKEKFEEMDIYGFKPRYFHICPGAIATFKHLISMENDEDTIGMIRSAAQVADNVFRIEDEVIKAESATTDQLSEATVLVDDFKDIINEIDKISGMVHDVSYMDGHIEVIKEYLREDMGYDNTLPPFVDEVPRKKKKKEENFETYNDYPEAAKNNACRAIKWAEENGWGDCGTAVGKMRANQLCGGENISEETISRMASFERHRQNKDVKYDEGCGGLMWDAWGGTEGIEWAQRKLDQLEKEKMSKQKFVTTDEEKRIVVGPAMVPDLKIFRKDEMGRPYYVYFSADTIKMIAEKYMRYKYIDNNDTNHNGEAAKDVYVIETWIKEDEQDKSNKYGYKELPVGTWFVSMKVRNDEVWEKIKSGELNGFSVSGYFEEIRQFSIEREFLSQVADILKKYDHKI